MDKNNLTRREAEIMPPEGGIFLCLDELVPSFIIHSLNNLSRSRKQSERARISLGALLSGWEIDKKNDIVKSYGKELENYVSNKTLSPKVRTMPADVMQRVETIEALYDEAYMYRGVVNGISATANRVSSRIATQLETGQITNIGLHSYGRIVGPYNYEFFYRHEDQKPHTLFDWGGEIDGVEFQHARFCDQVVLLSDILIQNGEQVSSP